MIFYIASYPRSGNSWVDRLVANQFKRLTSSAHGPPRRPAKMDEWINDMEDLYQIRIRLPSKTSETEWFLLYECEDGSFHRRMVNGCQYILSEAESRRQLALEDEQYFVKTHFRPYEVYSAGENVIQIVRNPGAAVWSYYNFFHDIRGLNVSLSDIILGKAGFGSWSEYHREWLAAADRLGSSYLRVRYEDLFDKELAFCDRLEAFTSLPIKSRELKPFEYYHARRPLHTRKGMPSGWERHYSVAQLELLWQEHGEIMVVFGYPEPDYSKGLTDPLH